jgi:hypothetical protein
MPAAFIRRQVATISDLTCLSASSFMANELLSMETDVESASDEVFQTGSDGERNRKRLPRLGLLLV